MRWTVRNLGAGFNFGLSQGFVNGGHRRHRQQSQFVVFSRRGLVQQEEYIVSLMPLEFIPKDMTAPQQQKYRAIETVLRLGQCSSLPFPTLKFILSYFDIYPIWSTRAAEFLESLGLGLKPTPCLAAMLRFLIQMGSAFFAHRA